MLFFFQFNKLFMQRAQLLPFFSGVDCCFPVEMGALQVCPQQKQTALRVTGDMTPSLKDYLEPSVGKMMLSTISESCQAKCLIFKKFLLNSHLRSLKNSTLLIFHFKELICAQ